MGKISMLMRERNGPELWLVLVTLGLSLCWTRLWEISAWIPELDNRKCWGNCCWVHQQDWRERREMMGGGGEASGDDAVNMSCPCRHRLGNGDWGKKGLLFADLDLNKCQRWRDMFLTCHPGAGLIKTTVCLQGLCSQMQYCPSQQKSQGSQGKDDVKN